MKKKPRNERKPTAAGNPPSAEQQEEQLKRKSTEIAKAYEPTPDEKTALETVLARRIKTPRLRLTEKNGQTVLSLDPASKYGDALLMQALATVEPEFERGILCQIGTASYRDGKANEDELNFILAVIKGIQPRDQLETMLALQMAAVHSLTIEFAGRLKNNPSLVCRHLGRGGDQRRSDFGLAITRRPSVPPESASGRGSCWRERS